MKREENALFLEREVYRSRRLIDAARLLPVIGAVLFIAPALFVPPAEIGEASTATRLLYFVGIWFALIIYAFVISRALRRRQLDAASMAEDPAADPSEAKGRL